MYHFFVRREQIADGAVHISGSDVNHIGNVLRMKPGEEILISDETGRDYRCVLSEVGKELVKAEILEELAENHELPSRIVLFQGLPKADKLELIIQKATELGAAEIVPVAMKYSVVKLDAKKAAAKKERWQAVAESAAKQSKRSVVPAVGSVLSWPEALRQAAQLDWLLVPYESAEGMEKTRRIIETVRPGQNIGIMVGPEGGFAAEEIEAAAEAGGQIITLGKRILRTETAGMALLAALMLRLDG